MNSLYVVVTLNLKAFQVRNANHIIYAHQSPKEVFQKIFPDYEIVGVDGSEILLGTVIFTVLPNKSQLNVFIGKVLPSRNKHDFFIILMKVTRLLFMIKYSRCEFFLLLSSCLIKRLNL